MHSQYRKIESPFCIHVGHHMISSAIWNNRSLSLSRNEKNK